MATQKEISLYRKRIPARRLIDAWQRSLTAHERVRDLILADIWRRLLLCGGLVLLTVALRLPGALAVILLLGSIGAVIVLDMLALWRAENAIAARRKQLRHGGEIPHRAPLS